MGIDVWQVTEELGRVPRTSLDDRHSSRLRNGNQRSKVRIRQPTKRQPELTHGEGREHSRKPSLMILIRV